MKKRREPGDDKTTPARSVSLPASFRPRSKPSPLVDVIKHLGDPDDNKFIPTRSMSLPTSGRGRFKHSPLDLDVPSIRLVRVLPGPSFDGRIHLDIRHASANSTYSCLSYVWGEQQVLCWIRLGGQLFQVGQNLHGFLRSVIKKSHLCSGWLWIDALCIDQSNKLERIHQVQQMGHIFSHAVRVISWLGTDERIAEFLRESPRPLSLFSQDGAFPAHMYMGCSLNDGDLVESLHPRPGMKQFFESDYWGRAWITQEVSLARFVTFMADDEDVDRWQPPEGKADVAMELRNHNSIYYENYPNQWKGRSLISILRIFCNKQCFNRLDRVFALLGLYDDGSDLKVDYDISNADLAKRVLRACSNSFCLCAIRLLNRVLNLDGSNAGLDATVAEQELFGTLILSMRGWLAGNLDPPIQLESLDKGIGHGGSIKIGINMSQLCRMYDGFFDLTILPGNCNRVQRTGKWSTLYYNECHIVITGDVFCGVLRKESQSVSGCYMSYDPREYMWHFAFPFASLVYLARIGWPTSLCSRADLSGNRKELNNWTGLQMSPGGDPYTNAPNLGYLTPESLPLVSFRNLRSLKVNPYLDSYGRPRHSAVFVVYDPEIDSEDVFYRGWPERRPERDIWPPNQVD